MLDKVSYGLDQNILLESVEVAAFKTEIPIDGPCIFTGRTATYTGPGETFNDSQGHILTKNLPLAVCDKTARALASLGRGDIVVTESTWHYQGGGCC